MRPTFFLPTLLHLTALLAVVPHFAHADGSEVHRRSLKHSQLRHLRLQQRALPTGWTAVGCYTDNTASRTLTSAGYADTTNMTVENCVSFCNTRNYIYAGVEYGQECYCGNAISNGGAAATASDCSFPCTGNANEHCGAGNRLNLYTSGAAPPAGPAVLPSSGPWTSLGCYSDTTAARTLNVPTAPVGGAANNSVESCTAACSAGGYTLAGVEYSDECYCGNTFSNGGAPTAAGDCSMVCSGKSSEICGGPNRLNVYTTSSSSGTSNGGWVSIGCYSDSAARTLTTGTNPVGGATKNSAESCTAACLAAGFHLAGMEYSDECYCGNAFSNGGAPTTASACSMPCSGNNNEMCGGSWALNVYNYTSSGSSSPPNTPSVLPSYGPWTSLGCYSDSVAARTLTVPTAPIGGATNNSVESCTTACAAGGYSIAGVEYSDECYCGNTFSNGGAPAAAGDCTMVCSGKGSEICGGPNRLNVYSTSSTTTPPPSGGWVSLGCYTDSVAARTLTVPTAPVGGATNNSAESCTAACFAAGYPLAGMEYSDECYCGAAFSNGGAPAAAGDCDMACSGNSGETCGGPNRLNVYNYTGTGLPATGGGGGGGGGGAGDGTHFPVLSGLPAGWKYNACWVDNAFGRIFQTELPDNQALTVESCVASCASQGFSIAGMEYSVQCFCGNSLVQAATVGTEASCNMGCGGNATEACGGPNRLSVYTNTTSITVYPVPTVQTTNLPGNWQYSHCLAEPGAVRVFPYQIILPLNNSAATCLSLCSTYGYPAAGMEFADECWCGDVADIAANGGTQAAETDCAMACSGDPLHLCGGAERLQLYLWNGNLNNWHTPTNIGQYEYLVAGLVPPLLATLGINGKVSFLEKGGTGFPNSTGAYELDLSLVNDFSHAWREMHVKTDVFCSAAVVLPDKAARILNVGGWSLESTYGIRLYAPDGSPGVNGTNDWEENPDTLQLQGSRWYPTALVLANGSVLVMGGETGSNAPANPTLEILPRIPGGNTQVFLDWLNRTDPNNLYPFLHVLPSGKVFAGYYNEARLLDPVTFATVQSLPNIPGSVTSGKAGRTYPMEGASVLLPQHAPYTDPITVLICGGSNFGIALDNCVTTQPEVANPTWVIERMPSKRVMPCIVALPDGTFFIANGAHDGVAGFGLASDPNLNALLYDPTQPAGSRFSILGSTTIARMYHSEATLLPDGRVLISGSDPQTPGLPEELRIEVYIPPYLSSGLKQPVVTVPNTDWAYGGNYQITIQTFQGQALRVSLVAAVSSTHGNTMGGRTIFPAFNCNGNTCTVTAPPNANVSPPGWHQLFILDGPTPSHGVFIRIGGDPGKLGNWPALPGFNPPGI